MSDSKYDYSELNEIASTTFLSQMVTAANVAGENPELYYEIQKVNPYKQEIFGNLENAVSNIADAISSGDNKAFIELMQEGRKWIEE